MITSEQATLFTEMLAAIPHFPREDGARIAIGDTLRRICDTKERALWLVSQCIELMSEWKGIPMLRDIYCTRYRPADGIEGRGGTVSLPQTNQPHVARLVGVGGGQVVTEARTVQETIEDLALAKKFESAAMKRKPRVRPIPVTKPAPRAPLPNAITATDVQRAVQELRAGKDATQ